MSSVKSHRDLLVWQRGIVLAEEVYLLSRSWPKDELYALTSQARRAAVSIPSNIAEGYGRQSRASYAHHLKIARGSLLELETHLLLAERVSVAKDGSCNAALAKTEE
ncbi:MAG: four helix bundle protein [Erythrobacter sp.]|nr:MAG: four helix bundle protein [Erythrobacter sp.]